MEQIEEKHYINRSNWLRAAVLGANDGIISTSSIAIGVAAASSTTDPVILATTAGLISGALSMAAGEYVSVSSQSDIEEADREREKLELKEMPEIELEELTQIYEDRGLSHELAKKVAKELTNHNALEAHLRDELGINEINQAKPLQAAFASGASFMVGAILPLFISLIFPIHLLVSLQYVFAIIFLMLLGYVSAKTGGAKPFKSILRITIWGTVAMGLSAFVGHLFGVHVA